MELKIRKRIKGIFIVIALIILALCARLYYIQVMCHEELKQGAKGQQLIEIQGNDQRGVIYDRNMVRLTNSNINYFYIFHRHELTPSLHELISEIDGTVAGSKGKDYVIYKSAIFDRSINRQLIEEHNAYAFTASSRYSDIQIAPHLIGYLNGAEGVGVSGLEKMYQDRLSVSPSRLSLSGNGIGAPVDGIGISEDQLSKSIKPSALVTTVDAALQTKVEKVLRDNQITGTAIVLQTKTGQVLAMASTPTFNPGEVDNYLESGKGELINKAVQGQYPPGSVFKIAVTVAALEHNIPLNTTFDCKGDVTVNGVNLICEERPEGHGHLTMEEAFAKSCNGYFAKLGEKLGGDAIIDTASRLGLGQTVIQDFPDEAAGLFPDESERAYSGLSNLSVGQGSLLTTPLQIAKMTNIIANGGADPEISLLMREKDTQSKQVVSKAVATEVKKMMRGVMVSGTAANGKTNVPSCGKTGSAEAIDQGKETVHGWFTGFFPEEDPEYTVTVLAENGNAGSSSALPVFEEIVNYLY